MIQRGMNIGGRVPLALSVVGILIAAASFIAYVLSPSNILTYSFVAGMAILAVGYAIAFMGHRGTIARYKEAAEEEEQSGLIVSLDSTYVPCDNPATITDLREERRCPASTRTSSTCSSTRPTCTGGTTTSARWT